jgi:hypothetical protein
MARALDTQRPAWTITARLRGPVGSFCLLFAGVTGQAALSTACGADDSYGGSGGDGGSGGGQGGTSIAGTATTCHSQLDCLTGHACELVDDPNSTGADPDATPAAEPAGFCAYECDDALCSPRICGSATGSCSSTGCKRSTDCRSDEFCETSSRTCRPAAGLCTTPADCLISKPVRDVATVACIDGSCRLAMRRPSPEPAPLPGKANLTVGKPQPGDNVPDLAKLKFTFTRTADPGFALIVPASDDTEPTLGAAVWGAVLPAGTDRCSWAAGNDVHQGEWQSHLSTPPTAGSFYFVLQTVYRGTLSGFTDLVPFAIAPAPREPGESCDDEGVVAGECASPNQVMGCFQKRCTRVCSSHAECEPGLCADPVNGVRYCQ